MPNQESSNRLGRILVGLVLALIGAITCTALSAYPISYCSAVPLQFTLQGLLLVGLCYFSGFAGLILLKSLTALKYGLAAGLAVTLALLVWNGIVALAKMLAMPSLDMTGITAIVGIGSFLLFLVFERQHTSHQSPIPAVTSGIQQSTSMMSKKDWVRALEVVQYPSDYLSSSDESRRTPLQIANHLVETLVRSGTPIGVRLQRIASRFRLIFLTPGLTPEEAESNLQTLERVLGSLLPGFTFKNSAWPSSPKLYPEKTCSVSHMTGEPSAQDLNLRNIDGLTAVAEMLKRTESDAVVQIWVAPHKPGFFEKRGAKRDFEDRIQSSPQSISVTKPGSLGTPPSQESYAALNPIEAAKRDKAARRLSRMNSEMACKVWVSAACIAHDDRAAERTSKQLLSTLAGSVGASDPQGAFEIKKGKDFVSVYNLGEPSGPSTVLLPHEAAQYLVLPRCDLGLAVADRGAFHTNPTDLSFKPQETPSVRVQQALNSSGQQAAEAIPLGRLIEEGGRLAGELGIDLEKMAEHFGVYGGTGSGKSNTAMMIVCEAWKKGVIPLILLPGKVADWRSGLNIIPETWVFTAGDETTAPFRFNPFVCPEVVLLNAFIPAIIDCFIATLPSEGIIKEHMETVFNTAFSKAGWNRRANKRGKTILVSDILEALLDVEKTVLQYSDKMNQDFVGALRARFSTLLRDPLLPIFNTKSGLSVKQLLSRPMIIEMRGLSREQKALLTSLLTVHIALYLEAQTTSSEQGVKGLKHVLVLEEAHHLLKRTSSERSVNEGHSAQQHAIGSIVGLLRESRASGLCVILIDQLPSMMAEEAVKLPGTTIIHYLNELAERTLVGLQANCSQDQIRHIGGMARGEAVVHITRTNQPVKVRFRHLSELVPGGTLGRTWTDKALAERMQQVFAKHPELIEWVEPPQSLVAEMFGLQVHSAIREQADRETSGLDPDIITDLVHVTETQYFYDGYEIVVDEATKGRYKFAALSIRNIVSRFVKDKSKIKEYCEYMVWYLRGRKNDPVWQAAHERIRQSIETEIDIQEVV